MRHVLRAAVAFVLALGTFALPDAAIAARPLNDDFASATTIASLPYSDSVDSTTATSEPSEPACTGPPETETVWYAYTPAVDRLVRATTQGSGVFSNTLSAWTGAGLGSMSNAGGCQSFGNPLLLHVRAGTTYYFRAAVFPFSGGGDLHFTVEEVPPPANDDFANAKLIGSVPYSDSVDATAATVEAGEPTPSCGFGRSPGTVWYRFTPSVSGSYSASSPSGGSSSQVAAYTGSDVSSLSQVGCRSFGQLLTFHADAGTPYYLQVGALFGGAGTVNVRLETAPSPNANFFNFPNDPSSFDTVQFSDSSFDPAGNGFSSKLWDFGDGATASDAGCCPTHRYAAEGDYEVRLTVTTTDGRTASASRTIQVRTHDVAIAKLLVPQSARAGQTRTIAVGISNGRYAETVEVDLYKSTPQGYAFAGSLTQSAPVRPAGRTTDFKIDYTFTSDDASLGKVTFKAVARIIGARDALPSDNEAIALPTKVDK